MPRGSERNRTRIEIAEGATSVDAIVALRMPPGDPYLVSFIGEVVIREERATLRLEDGDGVSIMPPLKGVGGVAGVKA